MTDRPIPTDYRPCVGIVLFNRAGQVWVGRRADMPGAGGAAGWWWQLPQGGIDKGEDPEVAARRELFEETAITSARIIGETRDWLRYDLPDELIGKIWGGKYRGQSQKWFAMEFQGDDSEINICPDGGTVEFDAWRWADFDDLVEMVVPFKRAVYMQVVDEFRELADAFKQ